MSIQFTLSGHNMLKRLTKVVRPCTSRIERAAAQMDMTIARIQQSQHVMLLRTDYLE